MLVLIHGQKEEKLFGQIINRYLRKPVLFLRNGSADPENRQKFVNRLVPPMLPWHRFCRKRKRNGIRNCRKKNELEKMAGDWHRMSDLLQAQAPAAREILEFRFCSEAMPRCREGSGVRLPAEITSVFAVPWSFSGCSERWKSSFVPITGQTAKCLAWPAQGKILNRKKKEGSYDLQ